MLTKINKVLCIIIYKGWELIRTKIMIQHNTQKKLKDWNFDFYYTDGVFLYYLNGIYTKEFKFKNV